MPRLAIAAAAFLAAVAGLLVLIARQEAPSPSDTVPIGGPFELTAHTGAPVTEADFRGRHMLIYFGYSYCPDVCPTELAKMSRALELAEAKGVPLDEVAPLFITLDPERDTPAQLAGYVELFHPRLIGLTGSPDAVAQAAAAYRIYHKKVADPDAQAGAYLVDHSSYILLMGPDGRFIDVFSARESAEEIAAALEKRLG